MGMSSLHKDPRNKSPFWYCAFTLADGRRAFRSTGKIKKSDAWIICQSFSEMEGKVAEGDASADQLMKVANAALKRLGHEPIQRPSAKQWFESWLRSEQGAVSGKSLERYSQIITRFLGSLGPKANARLATISTNDIVKFRDELLAGGRTPATVNHAVRKILKRPFKIALEEGLIDRNPVAAVRLLRGSTVEKGVFTPSHVSRLIEAAEGDWRGLILTAYYTGARLKDVATLTWANVDLVERHTIDFVQGKTGAKVRIPIHPQLEEYLLALPSSDSHRAPIFPELADKRGSGKDGLSTTFKRIMERAGIDGGLIRERTGTAGRNLSALSFHSLRHSFNSALANANVSQELRRKMTGHASEAMNDLYTHTELETLRGAVQSLPRLPKA